MPSEDAVEQTVRRLTAKGENMLQISPKFKPLVFAALCLALCLVLPFLTGQLPQVGQALSPMHLPVFLCGFLCGPVYAMCVGAVAPLLRFALFGMPPLFPTGIAMCFELFTYGLVAGLLDKHLPAKPWAVYVSLLGAMLSGRVVWGIVRLILSGVSGSAFTWTMFLGGAILNAIPGIIVQIVLVPILVLALRKAKIS